MAYVLLIMVSTPDTYYGIDHKYFDPWQNNPSQMHPFLVISLMNMFRLPHITALILAINI